MPIMCNWKPITKTRKGCYLLILTFIISSIAFSQSSILFIQPNQGKLIKAKPGDQLSISYKGYLGQTETYINILTEISDTTFVLGFIGNQNSFFKLNQSGINNSCKEIKYSDIIAFRKSGPGRTLLKSTLAFGGAIGSILILNRLYKQNEISDFGKIGISLGVGIGINMLINLALPNKPIHQVVDGWQINPLKE